MTRRLNLDSDDYAELDVDAQLQALSASAADLAYADGDGVVPETTEEVESGSPFIIPLLIPVNIESGDGRKLLEGSLSHRDLPIPLMWQPKTGTGHDGSYIVGRIDSIDELESGLGNARGVFDTGPYGREAERLVRGKMLRGVSADLDMFEASEEPEEDDEAASDQEDGEPIRISTEDISNTTLNISKARVMGGTLVAKPAFQECTIMIDDGTFESEIPVVDGVHDAEIPVEELADDGLATIAASAAPANPPSSWFDNPHLDTETALTIDDDGRVYGHIATWSQDHVGYNYSVRPPRSKSNYAYFHTGLVRAEEGNDIAVGQLTLAGGHAPLEATAAGAVKHYDDTASAVVDVHAGEDRYGIWVAGSLRPGVTPDQVRVLRASAPSGDWRPIDGRLELVAVCQVNVPGFPIARARVASGATTALIAAGAAELYRLRANPVTELEARMSLLESAALKKQESELAARFQPAKEAKRVALVAAAEAARGRMSPILEQKAEAHAALVAAAEKAEARLAEFKMQYQPEFEEKLHPRDDDGRWKTVLFKLSDVLHPKSESGDTPAEVAPVNDNGAEESVKEAVRLEEAGDTAGAEAAGQRAVDQLQQAAAEATDEQDKGVVNKAINAIQSAAAADPSGDLPEPVQKLIDQLIDELGEGVDPESQLKRLENRVKHLVDGKGFTDPEAIARLLQDMIQKKLTPGIAQ